MALRTAVEEAGPAIAEGLRAAAETVPEEYIEELRAAAEGGGVEALECPDSRALYMIGRRDGLREALEVLG